MTAECRPPPGTPDGTVCVLISECGRYQQEMSWGSVGRYWYRQGSSVPPLLAWDLHRHGWRFHSIATPTEGEG